MGIGNVTKKAVKRLRARREQLGLSQATVAERVGVNSSYIGLLERGERTPSLDVLLRASEAVGMTPAEVFADVAPPTPKEPGEIAELRALLASWSTDHRRALLRIARELDRVRERS